MGGVKIIEHLPLITVFLHFPAISKLWGSDNCTIGQGQIIFTITIEIATHAMHLQMEKNHILSMTSLHQLPQ